MLSPLKTSLLLLSSLTTLVLAADPAFRLSQTELDATLTCGNVPLSDLSGKDVMLLVPGTGSTAEGSFGHGYAKLAPRLNKTACSVSPPPSMLGDVTLNAEIIVNAINRLSSLSGKKIVIVGWSQGNLATQWGLLFFPSTRSHVSSFVALAPDFRGTTVAWALALPIVGNTQPNTPALRQQASNSNLIKALASYGGLNALVPTTVSASNYDQVVIPGIYSATLAGASVFDQQQACGPGKLLSHQGQLYDGFAYSLAKEAFTSPSGAASTGDKATCFLPAPGLDAADILALEATIPVAAASIIAGSALSETNEEPPLPAYAGGPAKRQLGRIAREVRKIEEVY